MKQISTIFLILALLPNLAVSQKHDYMWPLGLGPGWSEYNFFLDFNTPDLPSVKVRSDTISNGIYSASYCDSEGNILFYSNGITIHNKDGKFVENSEGLNPTITLPEWHSYSYLGGESGFFLQKPEDPNIVYYISLDFGPHPAWQWPYRYTGKNLLATAIDVSANNGQGKVVEKNKVLITGVLMAPAACRHANGRDWWLLCSDSDENRHYRVLMDPRGFSQPDTQWIGTKPNPIPYDGSNSTNQTVGNSFSPKGNYYVDANDIRGFSVFNFDRCSGLLSNERRVDYPYNVLATLSHYYRYEAGKGALFSQDERFFYKTNTYYGYPEPWVPGGTIPYLFQYDLQAPDFATSKDTINVIDSIDYHFPTNITWEGFYGAELAPDGRIYVVHEGNSYCTVQYPDRKGRDCKFVHDKPYFGVVISAAIPCMPNYRLGPLDGSGCDTLGLNNLPVAHFRVDDTLGHLSRYFYDLSHHEPASWHWDFGDGQESQERHALHRYDSAGTYQVCLRVENAYGASEHCRELVLGASGTAETHEAQPSVRVWPNPFEGRLAIEVAGGAAGGMLRVFNGAGKLVHQGRVGSGRNELELGGLPQGLYIWQLLLDGGRAAAGKVVKGR